MNIVFIIIYTNPYFSFMKLYLFIMNGRDITHFLKSVHYIHRSALSDILHGDLAPHKSLTA